MLLFWPLMFIPLGVMYLLRRAFSRFAMTLYRDGSIKITQPFNSQSIAREQLSVIVAKANNAHIGGSSAPIRVAIPWAILLRRLAQRAGPRLAIGLRSEWREQHAYCDRTAAAGRENRAPVAGSWRAWSPGAY